MNIEEFKTERILSVWQNQVKYNLTESGVQTCFPDEVFTKEEFLEIFDTQRLRYIQTNGTIPLKTAISQLYPGSELDNILVTNGSAEANFLTTWTLVEPGDEFVIMHPNYQLVPATARAFAVDVKPFPLREENKWILDVEDLREQVTPKTKLIMVTNPNNPTGSVLTEEAMKEIVNIADGVGAWLLADEIYRGGKLDGNICPSFWGMYDKVIINAGLSKAYSLPGLRIGWAVAPKELIEELWHHSDYTTITVGAINDRLACLALRPEIRERILERNRKISNTNLAILQDWISKYPGVFDLTPPAAGGIAFVRYNLDINSTDLTMKLIHEKSVFVVPGDCFDMDHFFRIGYAKEKEILIPALSLFGEVVEELQAQQ